MAFWFIKSFHSEKHSLETHVELISFRKTEIYIDHLSNYSLCFCMLLFDQAPAQAQNLRDSLAEAKSDIVVKVIF